MFKLDIYREFTSLFISSISELSLNSDSLFSLLKFILENYRFDIKFLRRILVEAEKLKFTPSPSGDEEKGKNNEYS